MTFAQQITFVRQKLYLSRSEMAKELCVTEQTIYRGNKDYQNLRLLQKGS